MDNVCLFAWKAEKMSRKDQKICVTVVEKMICLLSEKDRTSFLTVEKEWGYFSDKKRREDTQNGYL